MRAAPCEPFLVLLFDWADVLRYLASIPCLLLLAASGATAEIIDRIAVSVGNRVITASELDLAIRVSAFLSGVKPDFDPAARRAMAERMVEQKLMRRDMENSRYPMAPASEADALLADVRKRLFSGDASYRQALVEARITEQDLKDALLWQRTLLIFVDIRFSPGIQVGEQEVQDYFNKVIAPAARAANPGRAINLEDYRADIEKTLAGQLVDRETAQWLAEARRRTEITYHAEAFQ
jgi:hypothetical protein